MSLNPSLTLDRVVFCFAPSPKEIEPIYLSSVVYEQDTVPSQQRTFMRKERVSLMSHPCACLAGVRLNDCVSHPDPAVVSTTVRPMEDNDYSSGDETDGHTTDGESESEKEKDARHNDGEWWPGLDEREALALPAAAAAAAAAVPISPTKAAAGESDGEPTSAEKEAARKQRAEKTDKLRRSLSSSPVRVRVRRPLFDFVLPVLFPCSFFFFCGQFIPSHTNLLFFKHPYNAVKALDSS